MNTSPQRFLKKTLPFVVVLVLMLSSLFLVANTSANSVQFGRYYLWVLLLNFVALLALLVIIINRTRRLVREYRAGKSGSRLTVRLLVLLVGLSVPPVLIVYGFSVHFLNQTIKSWFDVEVDQALQRALDLSQLFLDVRTREASQRVSRVAERLSGVADSEAISSLGRHMRTINAIELTLLGLDGHIVGTSSEDPAQLLPDLPEPYLLARVSSYDLHAGAETNRDGSIQIRVLVMIPIRSPLDSRRILQARFGVSKSFSELALGVEADYHKYKNLAFLRQSLELSFILILSLVLLLSLLLALFSAFGSSRKVVGPLSKLADATREIADGDYSKTLEVSGQDELAFLVRSFNTMTDALSDARVRTEADQQVIEEQRAYLEVILERLSSGVIVLNAEAMLETVNATAEKILGENLKPFLGTKLAELPQALPNFASFCKAVTARIDGGYSDWRDEIMLFASGEPQQLVCRGSMISSPDASEPGFVLLIDDLTQLMQAQRNAAWAEVAKRLAHEVKNPLTPIQLAAERVRRKYLGKLADAGLDEDVLDRATSTIVAQVEALKKMVDAFSQYARAPGLHFQDVRISDLVEQVVDLYVGDAKSLSIVLEAGSVPELIRIDSDRIRQLLHNLIKNAREASDKMPCCVVIRLDTRGSQLHLEIADDGPGFPTELLERAFEPYATSKKGGTGLGLAIVKQIVDEHRGQISITNSDQGARIDINLPIYAPSPPQEAAAK